MSRVEGGKWLRFWREEAGLNHRELAERIGLAYYTKISNFELGRTRLPNEQFRVYADALGVDRAAFSRTLVSCYEPDLYECLFGSEPEAEGSTPDEMRARIARLEQTLSRLSS